VDLGQLEPAIELTRRLAPGDALRSLEGVRRDVESPEVERGDAEDVQEVLGADRLLGQGFVTSEQLEHRVPLAGARVLLRSQQAHVGVVRMELDGSSARELAVDVEHGTEGVRRGDERVGIVAVLLDVASGPARALRRRHGEGAASELLDGRARVARRRPAQRELADVGEAPGPRAPTAEDRRRRAEPVDLEARGRRRDGEDRAVLGIRREARGAGDRRAKAEVEAVPAGHERDELVGDGVVVRRRPSA
jgi:hypothetical protein